MGGAQDLTSRAGDDNGLAWRGAQVFKYVACEDPRMTVLDALDRFLTDPDSRAGVDAHRSRIKGGCNWGETSQRLPFLFGAAPVWLD